MNLTLPTAELNKALRRVSGAVGSDRVPIPALSSVLLTAKGQTLTVESNNCDFMICARTAVEIKSSGQCLAPFHRLDRLVGQLSGQQVEISVGDKFQMTVKDGINRTTFPGIDPAEFVPIKCEARQTVSVGNGAMASLIRKTINSVSTDQDKYTLTGIYFEADGTNLSAYAFNGYRFSGESWPVESKPFNFILPAKPAGDVLRLIEGDGRIELDLADNAIQFTIGDTTITSKLIAGNWPIGGTRSVLSFAAKHSVKIDREAILSAMRRLSVIHEGIDSKATQGVSRSFQRVAMTFSNNALELEAVGQGESYERLDIQFNGQQVLHIDAQKAIDTLKIPTTDEVELQFGDHLDPFLVRAGSFVGGIQLLR